MTCNHKAKHDLKHDYFCEAGKHRIRFLCTCVDVHCPRCSEKSTIDTMTHSRSCCFGACYAQFQLHSKHSELTCVLGRVFRNRGQEVIECLPDLSLQLVMQTSYILRYAIMAYSLRASPVTYSEKAELVFGHDCVLTVTHPRQTRCTTARASPNRTVQGKLYNMCMLGNGCCVIAGVSSRTQNLP